MLNMRIVRGAPYARKDTGFLKEKAGPASFASTDPITSSSPAHLEGQL